VDATQFLIDFQDHLAPRLDAYEQVLYLYVIRHSRAIGQEAVVIGFKSARKRMAFGIGQVGSPMSERVIYERLQALAKKGYIKILGTTHAGTKVRPLLPDEIDGVIPAISPPGTLSLEEMDFFNVPENRLLLVHREGHRCFYCLRQIDETNFVVEHVVSRPEGTDGYRNVVAACRQCNNRKGSSTAEDFLRTLYGEKVLSMEEFEARISHLDRLRMGELRPELANKALQLTVGSAARS
jgi:hypothetical protein